MSGQIFISYRREDTEGYTGRLYDRRHDRFPQNEIFMDVDMTAGIDFVEEIEKNVESCDVLIALIGKRWLTATDEEGKRWLDQPEDYVRLEVGTAFKRGIRVIPVLVDGASIPRSGELPEDLKPLVRRQVLAVSYERFEADSERLIGAVGRALESAQVELQRKRRSKSASCKNGLPKQIATSMQRTTPKRGPFCKRPLKPATWPLCPSWATRTWMLGISPKRASGSRRPLRAAIRNLWLSWANCTNGV
jgi:hypothetical protein